MLTSEYLCIHLNGGHSIFFLAFLNYHHKEATICHYYLTYMQGRSFTLINCTFDEKFENG